MTRESSGRAGRRVLASSVAPIGLLLVLPASLARTHPSHPDNEDHPEPTSPKPPVPWWRWVLWLAVLAPALVVFYVLLTPVWIGIRATRWLATRRSGPASR